MVNLHPMCTDGKNADSARPHDNDCSRHDTQAAASDTRVRRDAAGAVGEGGVTRPVGAFAPCMTFNGLLIALEIERRPLIL